MAEHCLKITINQSCLITLFHRRRGYSYSVRNEPEYIKIYQISLFLADNCISTVIRTREVFAISICFRPLKKVLGNFRGINNAVTKSYRSYNTITTEGRGLCIIIPRYKYQFIYILRILVQI